MRTIALLNCGLFLFLLSRFQLAHQREGHGFSLVLAVVMLVLLLVHLFVLRDGRFDRRLSAWATVPYGLFVAAVGALVLSGLLGAEPYRHTFAIFGLGALFLLVPPVLALSAKRTTPPTRAA